jgi:hypothetical protein
MSSIAIPNDYIINKKYKSLVKDILSYSELPSYFLSIDFIIYLGKFNNLLIKLNLCPTEYDYFETILKLFFVKDPITKKVVNIPLTPIKEISNKILDVLFELVELLKIKENILLSLIPNNCEILFKILSNLDVIDNLDINFLFDNYSYLLRNDIELIQNKFLLSNDIIIEINKQIFKQAVKEDIRTLLFIPDHKLSFSYDIIETAVHKNGLALKYVRPILFFKIYIFNQEIITNIIEIAVKNNGLSLQYIRSIFLLFSYKYKYSTEIITNIIKLAVQNNGLSLEFVTDDNITEDIIEIAVKNNGLALEFVDEKYLTYKIIEFAVKQNGLALQFINKYEEDENILIYKICILAIKNNALALQYVPDYNLTQEICMIAIQSNGLALQYVPRNIKTYEMCKLAVQSNSSALEYIPYPNRTKEIINIALQKN